MFSGRPSGKLDSLLGAGRHALAHRGVSPVSARATHLALVAALLLGTWGCEISHKIRDLEPVRYPPLTQLEQHLDYSDPDDGQPDYVRAR